MNNNKAAVIIDGPEDVLNSRDVNNPIITDIFIRAQDRKTLSESNNQ